jgi:hypothetical protein
MQVFHKGLEEVVVWLQGPLGTIVSLWCQAGEKDFFFAGVCGLYRQRQAPTVLRPVREMSFTFDKKLRTSCGQTGEYSSEACLWLSLRSVWGADRGSPRHSSFSHPASNGRHDCI